MVNVNDLIEKYEKNPYDITTVSLLYHELVRSNDERAAEFKSWFDTLVLKKRAKDSLNEVRYLDSDNFSEVSLARQVLMLQRKELLYKESRKTYSDCKRSTFIILAILLGFLGIHNFYIKKYGVGALQLFFYGLLACTGFGLALVYIFLALEMSFVKKDGNNKLLS